MGKLMTIIMDILHPITRTSVEWSNITVIVEGKIIRCGSFFYPGHDYVDDLNVISILPTHDEIDLAKEERVQLPDGDELLKNPHFIDAAISNLKGEIP